LIDDLIAGPIHRGEGDVFAANATRTNTASVGHQRASAIPRLLSQFGESAILGLG
jgi:hypothetical protein